MGKFLDLSGYRFGRLTVAGRDGYVGNHQVAWVCRCDCGGETRTTSTKLKSGHTQSCGCLQKERASEVQNIHGLCADGRHPLLNTYTAMIGRCHRETSQDFATYGARGIAVCDRWRFGEGEKTGFQCFVEDMGPRPSKRHTIDRENNERGYSPDNCRWATPTDQARNRRSNTTVVVDGKRVSLRSFCQKHNLRYEVIQWRLKEGFSLDRAITQPLRGGGSLHA
jgi:hypothetical protein